MRRVFFSIGGLEIYSYGFAGGPGPFSQFDQGRKSRGKAGGRNRSLTRWWTLPSSYSLAGLVGGPGCFMSLPRVLLLSQKPPGYF